MQKTLILGLGNDILCDDGIGMKIARDIEKLGTHPNFPAKSWGQALPLVASHCAECVRPDPGGKLGCVPNFSPTFSFLPASIDGLELLEVMDGYDKVFIIDAFKTNDMQMGEVAVFGVEDLSHSIYIGSPHSVNLATAIELCKSTTCGAPTMYNIPEKIIIIAINVFDTQTFSENLSPQLQEKYPQILDKVINIIKGKF